MSDQRPDRFQSLLAVAIAVATVFTGVIAYLQADASARDDRANRDSKRYSTEAFGRQVAGDARTNYDYYTAYQAWSELNQLASQAEEKGDAAAARRFGAVRERLARLTPMLAAPYFDAARKDGEPDNARWEADQYVVEVAGLREKFLAASAVKDAWDAKANTYIVHLTLLAAALALLGLSTTVPGAATRFIISGAGGALAVLAVLWAGKTWAEPVADLRAKSGAIEAYAKGAGLVHRGQHAEAVKEFANAVQAAPEYARAYVQRAEAYYNLEKYAEAAADYEKARSLGETGAQVAGMLARAYYQVGRFDDAMAMDKEAMAASPDELWVQYDLGLTQLASGKKDEAKATFKAAGERAAAIVAEAAAAKKEAPSVIWSSLDDVVDDTYNLERAIDGEADAKFPPRDKIVDGPGAKKETERLVAEISELSVALEYLGRPPQGPLTAKVENVRFAPLAANGKPGAEAEEIDDDVKNVVFRADFSGMKDGSLVVAKVYANGDEDPSWRYVAKWDRGAAATLEQAVASDEGDFAAGDYQVSIFVDGRYAGSGEFTVVEELGAGAPAGGEDKKDEEEAD